MAPNAKEAKSGEMMWHSPKENPKSSGKPQARSGHTLACANEKAYLFGGCGIEDGAAAVFNDLWILHIADNFRWEKVDAMGDVPSPRWRHTANLLRALSRACPDHPGPLRSQLIAAALR